MSHVEFWNALKITNPAFTKEFRRPGFSGTDINPTWRLLRMTEVFGPCGEGWGWEMTDRWREDFEGVSCVYVSVRVWWRSPEGGELRFTGEQIGGTVLQYDKQGKPMATDELYKMAITDAFGKCVVALGLGADIYLGQWDSSKYQREAAEHYAAKGPVVLLDQIREKLATLDLEGVNRYAKEVADLRPSAEQRPAIKALFEARRMELA